MIRFERWKWFCRNRMMVLLAMLYGNVAIVEAAPTLPTPRDADIVIQVKTTKEKKIIPMEFVSCPAGSFEMGCVGDDQSPLYRHNVKISRKFWIGKYQVTREQWGCFFPNEINSYYPVWEKLGGRKCAKADLSYHQALGLCDILNRKYKKNIPSGYVFRLPTEAEWEYALKANCDDASNPYVRFMAGDEKVAPEIMVVNEDYKKLLEGTSFGRERQYFTVAVGTKKPNVWGIYDMLGNNHEYVLDTFSAPEFVGIRGRWGRNEYMKVSGILMYTDNATDPVHIADTKSNDLFSLTRSMNYEEFDWQRGMLKVLHRAHNGAYATMRIVIGPDLLKGKKPIASSKKKR